MSSTGLKPCKHCGGEADVRYDLGARLLYSDIRLACGYRVGCNNPECEGFIFRPQLYPSEPAAIREWNDGQE